MNDFRVLAPGEPDPERLAMLRDKNKAKAKRTDAARARWTLLNAFVDHGMASLRSSDAVVWYTLFRHADADGVATVARRRLVESTGLAPDTVKASLRRLRLKGWIARLRQGGPQSGIAIYGIQNPLKKVG